jgi:hypothetical protein
MWSLDNFTFSWAALLYDGLWIGSHVVLTDVVF